MTERGARSAERGAPISSALLFLIGPRGSGKSSVARLLAEALRWEWIDSDAALETRCGKSIRDVFAAEGEPSFRQHEAEVLTELCTRRRIVVATGGGVVLREDNRERLKTGMVVWLTADVDTLWQRIRLDPLTAARRPALHAATLDGRAEVEHVLRTREPLYRACADVIVDTTGRAPEEVACLILSSLTSEL